MFGAFLLSFIQRLRPPEFRLYDSLYQGRNVFVVQDSLCHHCLVSWWLHYLLFCTEKTALEYYRSLFVFNRLVDETVKHGLYLVIGFRAPIMTFYPDQNSHSNFYQSIKTRPWWRFFLRFDSSLPPCQHALGALFGPMLHESDSIREDSNDILEVREHFNRSKPFEASNVMDVSTTSCTHQTLLFSYAESRYRPGWEGWTRDIYGWLGEKISWRLSRTEKNINSTSRCVVLRSISRYQCWTMASCWFIIPPIGPSCALW